MRKIISIISSLLFVTIVSAKAEIGIGISGAAHMIMGDGNETTRSSGEVNSGSHDESVFIPEDIDYQKLSGLSNEIKSKLLKVKPKTLGQAIRIDGVTPAAIIILLSHIKKLRYKASA